MSPGPPLANSSEAPERSHSRAPSASLQRLWDASLMRSRLAFKKVGPEDWGLRQKASQVYARGGLAGELASRPPAFSGPSESFVYINDVSRIPAYSGRAAPNERGQLRTLPRRDRGGMGWARCRQRGPGRRQYKICASGCLWAPAPGSICHMPGIWPGRHSRSRGRDLESRVVKLKEKLQKPATPLLPIN